jgi:hypothetical protein
MNKVKKYIILTVIILIAYIGVNAVVSDVQRKNYKLNDRQIAILKEMDMSTDWEELTNYQQDCIMSIEEMLEYLEKKYDKEFCYGGYIAENGLYNDKEELLAYAKGDNRETDCFGVRPTKFGYEDDYAYIYLLPCVKDECVNELDGILDGYNYYIDPVIGEVKNDKAQFFSLTIVVEMDENGEYKKLGRDIEQVLDKNNNLGNYWIYIVNKGVIKRFSEGNYEDFLTEDNVINHYRSTKNSEGRKGKWEDVD